MRTVTQSHLHDHMTECLDEVEQGERLEIRRNGKPVAMVSPIRRPGTSRWKTARPVQLNAGVSLSGAILEEWVGGFRLDDLLEFHDLDRSKQGRRLL